MLLISYISIIINKIVFYYDLTVCALYLYIVKSIYLRHSDRLTEIKAYILQTSFA